MAIIPVAPNFFIVDTEAERSTSWGDGVQVFCKDTTKTYILNSSIFKLIGIGVNLTVSTSEPTSPSSGDLWVQTSA